MAVSSASSRSSFLSAASSGGGLDLIRRVPNDEYELLQRVGSGTYGAVYKARHLTTGEFAAVKVIKLEPGKIWNFSLVNSLFYLFLHFRRRFRADSSRNYYDARMQTSEYRRLLR